MDAKAGTDVSVGTPLLADGSVGMPLSLVIGRSARILAPVQKTHKFENSIQLIQ